MIESLEGRCLLTSGAPFQLFDSVAMPALPFGWSNNELTPGAMWGTASGGSHTAPNHAFIPNVGTTSDNMLLSPLFIPTASNSRVSFRHSFDTESTFDGGVLEISINSGAFQDIRIAGAFITGGYNGSISQISTTTPLAGRQAWTGNSNGYIVTTVQLPATALNQNVRLGWRFASDVSIAGIGWRVDSIAFEGPITPIDLATLTPAQGTTLFGVNNNDQSGKSVSIVGDVNGDGYDDMVIGAPKADGVSNAKSNSGESYLVFGRQSPPASIDLSLPSSSVNILGINNDDETGQSVASAGDINGDGLADFIIGANLADSVGNGRSNAGESYVIFGKLNWSGITTIDLTSLGTEGITIFGADNNDNSGFSVSRAGDVNGDGFDDLIVGGFLGDSVGNGRLDAGDSYLIFGKENWSATPTIDLASLGSAGIAIFGSEGGDQSGSSARSVGDINGDGYDDLAIGAPSADGLVNGQISSGETYVLFGKADWTGVTTIDLETLNVATGIRILGADGADQSGISVSSAGDVNGDGFDDLAIGAGFAGGSGNGKPFAGDSYIVYGKAAWTATPIVNLASLGAAGVTIFGAEGNDFSGKSVSGGGDLNGDGFDDLVIGANNADAAFNLKNLSGDTYVVFGGPALPATIDLTDLGNRGLAIFGRDAGDESGVSVSLGGDVNGDGFDDLLIGANYAVSLGNPGESYLIFGGNGFTNSIPSGNIGTTTDNVLSGTTGADILNGADGNDFLIGEAGADILLGGRGDDNLIVSDLAFKRIVGGNGTDTLFVDGGGLSLNLLSIPDNRLVDIERIDITGTTTVGGGNTLTLTQREVLNISGAGNTLTVIANASVGDRVRFEPGWTKGADSDGFQRFTKGAATLRVTVDVPVSVTLIELGTLGSSGTTIFGAGANDQSGFSVSDAGDVNGDGYDDFIIGARSADASGNSKSSAGDSYVIFGAASLPATIDLFNLGSAGFTIFGADTDDSSGISVSSAGDVNGDGFGDLIIGANGADASGNTKSYAGDSYVIFGKLDWSTTATIDLAALSSAGVTIFGADEFDLSGESVSGAGDVNGDGFDDLIIGASSADRAGLSGDNEAGESYLIFGAASFPPTIDLANLGVLGPSVGITLIGAEAEDQSGGSVSGAGDVNGDGFDDLLIGAPRADASGNMKSSAGDSYVIFGKADWSLTPTIDLANLGSAGVIIFGAGLADDSGTSVTGAGDVNGDGFDDLVIGSPGGDASLDAKPSAGDSYVIFGKANWSTTPTIDLANLGPAGVTIFGSDANDASGRSVSGAGDVNGDGFDDLIIGAFRADSSGNTKNSAGDSYVVFGAATLPATIDLNTLGSAGITLFGADAGDESGRAVSRAGDVNGDGFDDLIIGAYKADAAGNGKSNAGESYLIFGGNGFTNSILTANLGNSNSNNLNGTTGVEILNGADGNDTIAGLGDADVILGGRGDDTLRVTDLDFKRIVGGNGSDTLRLDGDEQSMNLDLIRDNRILGIETIDITGTGNNILRLNHREVLNISDETNTLLVRRNAGDTVNIGPGWTQLANETIGPDSFLVYAQGQAKLKIQAVGTAAVSGRQLFYNRSTSPVFGNGSGNPINSIAPDKQALLPGNLASFANVSNFLRGLNGLVLDIANVGGLISAADLQFATSNGASPLTFTTLTATPTITVIPEGGVFNSTRIKIEFDDNAIRNTWLRVTVLANAATGLASNDVFYFGSAVGEMNVGNLAGPPVVLRTNASDTANVRQNQAPNENSVGITSVQDLNKDGRVNATDTANVRQNQTPSGNITLFTAPSSLQLAGDSALIDSAFADTSWLEAFQTQSRLSLRERSVKR